MIYYLLAVLSGKNDTFTTVLNTLLKSKGIYKILLWSFLLKRAALKRKIKLHRRQDVNSRLTNATFPGEGKHDNSDAMKSPKA